MEEVPLSPEDYLALHEPPKDFRNSVDQLNQFIDYWFQQNKKIALVTSGGTTVPLENNTVRFIDNFSAGTRGATSAEYFLENDYAVIFLHRQFSLQPYSRHFSHTTNCFLEYLTLNFSNDKVEANTSYDSLLKEVLKKYQKTKEEGTLLMVSFVTVTDYLFLLTEISKSLNKLKSRALFYLAAAVSDFFIHPKAMSEHKIQSRAGELQILMSKVPKFLKPLVKHWAPQAYIVSFKLETDPNLLIPKAQQALAQYGHQLVIANLLNTRKYEVWFIYPERGLEREKNGLSDEKLVNGVQKIELPHNDEEVTTGAIEMKFLPMLCKLHDQFISLGEDK